MNMKECEVKLDYSHHLDLEDEYNLSIDGNIVAWELDDKEMEEIEAKCGIFKITIFDEDWRDISIAADIHSQESC
jgi:hypothetical protein